MQSYHVFEVVATLVPNDIYANPKNWDPCDIVNRKVNAAFVVYLFFIIDEYVRMLLNEIFLLKMCQVLEVIGSY